MDDLKQCSRCDRKLPKNAEYYHLNKATNDGLHTICKECRGNKFGISKPRAIRERTIDNLGIVNGEIECKSCSRWLPLDETHFFKHSKSLLGFEGKCKECKGRKFGVNRSVIEFKILDGIEYKKCTSCSEFKENNLTYFARARGKNLETRCRNCTNTYLRNSDKAKVSGKRYREKPEVKVKINGYGDKYSILPSSREKHKFREQKRRSIKNSCISNLTIDEWYENVSHWTDSEGIHCAYCDSLIDKPQQEHIIPVSSFGGYTKWNIIPVGGWEECGCNQSKNNKSLNEFYEYSDSFKKESYLKVKNFILLHSNNEYGEIHAFLF